MSSTIETVNTRVIDADPELVFALAANVVTWPDILPHYRYVRVLSDSEKGRTVAMGATRSGIPVRWTAVQKVNPTTLEIAYRHVAGVTRGMDVLWKIESSGSGARATITHQLRPQLWWLRTGFTQWVVGRLFVMNIAELTLIGIGRHAEMASQ